MSHRKNLATDDSPAGRAIRQLFVTMRRDIEDQNGGWNGGDTVEALCEWFSQCGFDVDGPNPFQDNDDHDDNAA